MYQTITEYRSGVVYKQIETVNDIIESAISIFFFHGQQSDEITLRFVYKILTAVGKNLGLMQSQIDEMFMNMDYEEISSDENLGIFQKQMKLLFEAYEEREKLSTYDLMIVNDFIDSIIEKVFALRERMDAFIELIKKGTVMDYSRFLFAVKSEIQMHIMEDKNLFAECLQMIIVKCNDLKYENYWDWKKVFFDIVKEYHEVLCSCTDKNAIQAMAEIFDFIESDTQQNMPYTLTIIHEFVKKIVQSKSNTCFNSPQSKEIELYSINK